MKKLLIIGTGLVATALLSTNALAEKSFTLDLSATSTADLPQVFYCTTSGVKTNVFLNNFGQMIKGFNERGQVFISPEKLNTVYFQAYHDPDPKYANLKGWVTAVVTGPGEVKCYFGTGDRKLVEGDFK